jgi:hypothetical protein
MRRSSMLFLRRYPLVTLGLAALMAASFVVGLARGSGHPPHTLNAGTGDHCRPGFVPADGPIRKAASDRAGGDQAGSDQVRSSHRACVPIGQPETFGDLGIANSEQGARDAAPFTSSAPGAYMHAVAQRRAMARAGGASGGGAAWKVAGSPPECAAQTQTSACPAPNADNGNYGYTGKLGFRTLSGRISSFAYDPSAQGRYFASPVVGGVWESVDSGATWHSIGDGLPTQVVGAIVYDAPHHRIIVGTGDNSFGGDGIAGHGIYYSDDDGATWQTAAGIPDLALSFKVVVSPADPSGDTVYAATSKGLFRSVDGGGSFVNEKLPTSPAGYSPNCQGDTTSKLCFFANDVTDVAVRSAATSNGPAGAVIAAVGWRAGQKIDNDAGGSPVSGCTTNGSPTNCLQAPQNGLYTSSDGTPGSFSYIAPGPGGVTGLPPTDIFGRTALGIAHGTGQNPDAVYAIVQDAQKFNGCADVLDQSTSGCNPTVVGEGVATVLDGMYASYDFGKTWTKIMDYTQLKQVGTNSALLGEAGYNPGVQSWYNLWVDPDPTATDATSHDPTRLLFGLEEVWENNQVLPQVGTGGVLTTPYAAYPGGTPATDPWVVIGRYWNACGGVSTPVGPCNPGLNGNPIPGSTTHPDQHADAMIPDGKGGVTLLIGSDGGIYSQHVASGADFSNDGWGDGLNTTISAVQPYDAEMAKDGTIVSGLQDNGEMKTAPNGREAEIYGGDAFYSTIDPNNSQNIIEEYTYAEQVNLSTDGGGSWYSIDQRLRQPVHGAPRGHSGQLPGHHLALQHGVRSEHASVSQRRAERPVGGRSAGRRRVRGLLRLLRPGDAGDPIRQRDRHQRGWELTAADRLLGGLAPGQRPVQRLPDGQRQAARALRQLDPGGSERSQHGLCDPRWLRPALDPARIVRRGHEQRRGGARVRLARPRRALHQRHRQPARHLGQLDRVPRRPADRRDRPRCVCPDLGGHRQHSAHLRHPRQRPAKRPGVHRPDQPGRPEPPARGHLRPR